MNDPDRSLVNSDHYRTDCSTLTCAWLARATAQIAIDRRATSAAEMMRNLVMESPVLGGPGRQYRRRIHRSLESIAVKAAWRASAPE